MPWLAQSTADIPDRDQAAFWREVATQAFVRHDFRSSSGSRFRGTLHAGSVASLDVATFDCESCLVTRTAKDAARDDHDDIQLSLAAVGRTAIIQDDRQKVVEAGDLILVDTRRAFSAHFQTDTKASVITLPRSSLEARLGRDALFAGHIFDRHHPVIRLLAAFVGGLPDCINSLDPATSLRFADQVLDLVAIAYTATADRKLVALSSARGAALLRLKVGIDHLLANPELKPAMAAAAAGISVRYANALLAQEGTSIEEYIVLRRLDRCRQTLEDPAQAHRSIADVAFGWGFWSISHFCRRFKSRYGLSPGDYRMQMVSSG